MVPAPLGGSATGPNPTDRAKCGTKRHLLIDGNGAPLGLYLSGANRHNMKGVASLLDEGLIVSRPKPSRRKRQHLCLDKAYDSAEIEQLVAAHGYVAHIKKSYGEAFISIDRRDGELLICDKCALAGDDNAVILSPARALALYRFFSN